MKKLTFYLSHRIAFLAVIFVNFLAFAQTSLVRIDNTTPRQKITGFGGFVCSPTFAYNHMSTAEIKKMWGAESEAGYNIMRLFIPDNKSNWSSVLATAQLAKSMGLIVFASPWTMPAEWKTNNHINAVYTDTNGVKHIGYLKEENYQDYALYLNDFVTYLKDNGVDLDYISVQNEPDEMAEYHGCIWTPTQIASFVKNYGHLINCKVIAPESVGFSDSFANAFLNADTMANFEVYGGHQYGGLQSAYKQFQNYNKEIWMTEYLINWNSNNGNRNFDWNTDAFNFAKSINDVILGGGSAWIHYATKRYYGMMGDGQYGTTTGEITKRGRILSHFAKFTTGSKRLDAIWSNQGTLQGSAYINDDKNKITLIVINSSSNAMNMKVDLPFYSTSVKKILTTASLDMNSSDLTFTETFRPTIQVDASSVATFVFDKSNTRETSQMTAADVNYNKIESQTITNASFGNGYQLTGKTVTFYNPKPLISTNTNAANGYLALDDRYNSLVFHVNSYTTTGSTSSSNTTLYYVDDAGTVKSYNYGSVALPSSGSANFDIVFDISRNKLTTGCKGIIGLTSGNYSSVLTFNLGDVYFALANEKGMNFSGSYSNGDSNLLDAYENVKYTSLDFRNTSNITFTNWRTNMANKNSIFYTSANLGSKSNVALENSANVVSGTVCSSLELSDQAGDFCVPSSFTATSASYTKSISGYAVVVLPFEANIPTGLLAYTMLPSESKVLCTALANQKIPANRPVLVNGNGTFIFTGSGNVSTPKANTVNQFNTTYNAIKAYTGGYVLKTVNGVTGFSKITNGNEVVSPFSAYITELNSYTASVLPLEFGTLAATDISRDNLQLYPSPAKNEIFLNWKSDNAMLEIIDATGNTMSNKTKLINGKNLIDISRFAAGVYFVEVSDSGKTFRTKFIKQ